MMVLRLADCNKELTKDIPNKYKKATTKQIVVAYESLQNNLR